MVIRQLIKSFVQKLFTAFGYKIYIAKSLPRGLSLTEDIQQLSKSLNIQIQTIFDVGANIGQSARTFSKYFPNAAIYSFEPVTPTYEKLLFNTKKMNNVQCFQIAFGKEKAELEINLSKYSEKNSLIAKDRDSLSGKELIKVDTIDAFINQLGLENIDFLKIDTEGYDINVILGAEELLASNRLALILCEVGFLQDEQRFNPLWQVIDVLHQYGFALYGIYDQRNWGPYRLGFSNALFVNQKKLP